MNATNKDAKPANPEQVNVFLHCMSGDRGLVIDATDGVPNIAIAKKIFPGFIDPSFKKKVGVAKPITPVTVYRLVNDATHVQMFGSLGAVRQNLCLTQAQIIKFCEQNRTWLNNNGTLFLFEEEGNFFVANVFLGAGICFLREELHVIRFWDGRVWSSQAGYRVVVPQL